MSPELPIRQARECYESDAVANTIGAAVAATHGARIQLASSFFSMFPNSGWKPTIGRFYNTLLCPSKLRFKLRIEILYFNQQLKTRKRFMYWHEKNSQF